MKIKVCLLMIVLFWISNLTLADTILDKVKENRSFEYLDKTLNRRITMGVWYDKNKKMSPITVIDLKTKEKFEFGITCTEDMVLKKCQLPPSGPCLDIIKALTERIDWKKYIVKSGDTLEKIAKTMLGSASNWKKIARYNHVPYNCQNKNNPIYSSAIRVGETLFIPNP